MRTLIYTIAYGAEFHTQAEMMINSLRGRGEYRGDIAVFTDRQGAVFADVAGGDGRLVTVQDQTPLGFHRPHMAKAYAGQRISAHLYDKVMFLDADILVINPVQPMFDIELKRDIVAMPVEGKLTPENKPYFRLESDIDYTSIDLHCYNTGTIIGNGQDWSMMCSRWWDAMITHKAWELPACDQPVFNSLQIETGVHLLPQHAVAFLNPNSCLRRDTVLMHPKGPHRTEIMRHFNALIELYASSSNSGGHR
jgi:hypothetical protein